MTTTVLLGDLEATDANRSVLELLGWMHRQGQPARVVSRLDGPLRAEVGPLADVFVANDWRLRRPSTALQAAGLHRPAEIARSFELRRRLAAVGPVAYLAGVGAAPLLDWLPDKTTVVGHLHRRALRSVEALDEASSHLLRTRVSRWVVGSDDARRALQEHLGIDGVPTDLVHDFVAISALSPTPVPAATRAERDRVVRERLQQLYGIPVDAPLVCGRGVVDFWHQTNVFAQLCWNLLMKDTAPQRSVRCGSETRAPTGWCGRCATISGTRDSKRGSGSTSRLPILHPWSAWPRATSRCSAAATRSPNRSCSMRHRSGP